MRLFEDYRNVNSIFMKRLDELQVVDEKIEPGLVELKKKVVEWKAKRISFQERFEALTIEKVAESGKVEKLQIECDEINSQLD